MAADGTVGLTPLQILASQATQLASLEQRVLNALDEIRPLLQNDGGDIEYLGLTPDNRVRVRLTGACSTCASATLTLQMGVETNLMEMVPEITGLWLEPPAQPEEPPRR